MTKRQQAQAISEVEGKKVQVSFSNIMEVLTIQERLIAEEKFYKGITGSRILAGIDRRSNKLAVAALLKKAKLKKRGRK